MTDAPTPEMARQGVPARQRQPYTVILMLPDEMRSDECCAADWLRRVWVYGDAVDQGTLIDTARRELAILFGWAHDESIDRYEMVQRMSELEPVAIYAGHIFDVYES